MTFEKSDPLKQAQNPEQRNAQILFAAFQRGIVDDEKDAEIIGYHGTSVEVLKMALKTGTLLGMTTNDDRDEIYKHLKHTKGDLFLAPVLQNIPGNFIQNNISTYDVMSRKDAEFYAEYISKRHFILDQLGISFDDEDAHSALVAICTDSPESAKELIGWGEQEKTFLNKYGTERVATLLKEAEENRLGVVVSIKKSAFDEYGIGLGDPGHGDIKIMSGETGIDIKHIAGIAAPGPEGKAFFDELRQRM